MIDGRDGRDRASGRKLGDSQQDAVEEAHPGRSTEVLRGGGVAAAPTDGAIGAVDVAQQLERARTYLEQLVAANRDRDPNGSARAGNLVRLGLQAVRAQAKKAVGCPAELLGATAALEREAEPHLAASFSPSCGIHGARTNPAHQQEAARWKAAAAAKEQIKGVTSLNDDWIASGIPLAERARRAFEVRHRARMATRDQMQSGEEGERQTGQEEINEHGASDDASFEQLVEQHRAAGMTLDQAYEAIIGRALI